jgi:hypothetical protein
MLATAINPLGAALFYLAIAVPLAVVAARLSRKPLLASAAVSAAVLVASATLRGRLPFHFRYHANDFIIEPLIRDRVIGAPIPALATLAFHIGLPVLVGVVARRRWDIGKHAVQGFEVLPEAKPPEARDVD